MKRSVKPLLFLCLGYPVADHLVLPFHMKRSVKPLLFLCLGYPVADHLVLPLCRCGGVSYQKIWLKLQALAWNNPDIRARLARVNAEWRAVLTEAFDQPGRELGIKLPLEALASGSSSSAWAASRPGTAHYWIGSSNGYPDDRARPRAVTRAVPR
jgi:hypothetical protein